MEMSADEIKQEAIDLNATDILEHAKDFFACFDGLREIRLVLLDSGVVQLHLPPAYATKFEAEFSL